MDQSVVMRDACMVTIAAGLVCSLAAVPAYGGGCDQMSVWGGGSGNWSAPENWTPEILIPPLNITGFTFCVEIPASSTVLCDVSGEIDTLVLGSPGTRPTLRIDPTGMLTVLGSSSIDGFIDVCAGTLTAEGAGTVFHGNRASIAVKDAGMASIGGTTMNTTGLTSAEILKCGGAGSLLDLDALTEIDASFNDGSVAVRTQTISATGGGELRLPNVMSVTGPTSDEDRLEILVDGADSEIDLSSLESLQAAGRNRIHVTNGGSLELPSIMLFDDTEVWAAAGSSVVAAGPGGALMRTFGLTTSSSIIASFDPGALLDLSALSEIDASFNDGSVVVQVHSISTTGGGELRLPNVTTITGPPRDEDRLDILVDGADSEIDLGSLESLQAAGRNRIHVTNGGSLELPSIMLLDDTEVWAAAGSSVVAPGSGGAVMRTFGLTTSSGILASFDPGALLDLSALSEIDASFNDGSVAVQVHTISATGGGDLRLPNVTTITGPTRDEDRLDVLVDGADSEMDLGSLESLQATGRNRIHVTNGGALELPSIMLLDDTEVWAGAGSSVVAAGPGDAVMRTFGLTTSSDILASFDPGALLDLSALSELDASFNDGSVAVQVHTVSATGGGEIRMPNVDTISGPIRGEDRLDISVDGSGMLTFGTLAPARRVETSVTGAGSLLSVIDDIALSSPATLSVMGEGRLQFGGHFSHTHTNVVNVALSDAVVTANGTSQTLEAAGLNVGGGILPDILLADCNFGIRRLEVGAAGPATTLQVVDHIDNGHRGNGPEALYLWGDNETAAGCSPDLKVDVGNGLAIAAGSTLVVDPHVQVYAYQMDGARGGNWVHINCLFPPGETMVEFDEGMVELVFPCPGDADGDAAVNFEDLNLLLDHWSESTCNGQDGDVDGSGFVDFADLNQLLDAWGDTCP